MTVTDFVVTGSGEFPFDMLRYDACWPASSRDVELMVARIIRRSVRLRTVNRHITDGRWASFGWTVGDVSS